MFFYAHGGQKYKNPIEMFAAEKAALGGEVKLWEDPSPLQQVTKEEADPEWLKLLGLL